MKIVIESYDLSAHYRPNDLWWIFMSAEITETMTITHSYLDTLGILLNSTLIRQHRCIFDSSIQ